MVRYSPGWMKARRNDDDGDDGGNPRYAIEGDEKAVILVDSKTTRSILRFTGLKQTGTQYPWIFSCDNDIVAFKSTT